MIEKEKNNILLKWMLIMHWNNFFTEWPFFRIYISIFSLKAVSMSIL